MLEGPSFGQACKLIRPIRSNAISAVDIFSETSTRVCFLRVTKPFVSQATVKGIQSANNLRSVDSNVFILANSQWIS